MICHALDMDLLYDINLQEMAMKVIGDKRIKLGHGRLAKGLDQLHLLIAEPLLVNFFKNQPSKVTSEYQCLEYLKNPVWIFE